MIRIKDKGSKSDIPKYLEKHGYHFTSKVLDNANIELHIKKQVR